MTTEVEEIIDEDKIKQIREEYQMTDERFLKGRMSSRLTQWVDYLKSKHRTDTLLEKWFTEKYYSKQPEIFKLPEDFRDEIERVHVNDLTVEEFQERYEKADRPVII